MGQRENYESNPATSGTNDVNPAVEVVTELKPKRKRSESLQDVSHTRKMPKRAAACPDFTEKPFRLSKKVPVVESKRDAIADDEISALRLTAGPDHPRPNRRLADFIFHDAEGNPRSVETLEVCDIFISGRVLPLEENIDNKKEKGARCEGFGRLESWNISGYEEGTPVIWVSTELADYDCGKPSPSYKKLFNLFYEKAHACIEVYKVLSKSGGKPDLTLDELVSAVVRSFSRSNNFSSASSIKDFVITQGAFIYQQLIGLDETSKGNDQIFSESPVLVSLRDEKRKEERLMIPRETSSGGGMNRSLKIGENLKLKQSNSSMCEAEETNDVKLAQLMQEEENWQTRKQKKNHRTVASNKFYIKINEDEIANDYPFPAYYVTSHQETDEYLIFDGDSEVFDPNDLPRSMLHNWSFYNSDTRLVSLELLPMKPCAEMDVTIYGSGIMTADDGSGFCLDTESTQSSSTSSGAQDADGIPIYLSSIKEWMIEFGASMVFISIRTDLAWYRLGKPSKPYAPWYEPVLKTARLGITIITLLKEQSRVARLSYVEIIKRVSELDKNHPAFISSDATAVDRYVVVHGQILLQQFAEYPDATIRKCAFITRLRAKMEERHHTKWLVKKKAVLMKNEVNSNPRAVIAPVVSKRKAMQATTTRLINRIWGEFYSNYSPEDSKEEDNGEVKADDQVEEEQEEKEDEDSEEVEEEKPSDLCQNVDPNSALKSSKLRCSNMEVKWNGEPVGKTCAGEDLYKAAFVHGDLVTTAGSVLVETDDKGLSPIYFVEYMFETSDARKMVHGRVMQRGFCTVLGSTANEREVFLTNTCVDFDLSDIIQPVVVEMRLMPWGHQHKKDNADYDKRDKARAEERKNRGLPMEFYCKSLYWPERGAFFCLPYDTMGLGTGLCHSCRLNETQKEKETFKVNSSMTGFTFKGSEYCVHDFVYLAPHHFASNEMERGTYKSGRNIGLKAYVVCHLLEIEVHEATQQADPESTKVKVRRFFRPEDISAAKAYHSDIREVYYSEQVLVVSASALEGKCDVRKKHDLPSLDGPAMYEHTFFCECLYDADQGTVKQLPVHVKLSSTKARALDDAAYRKKKGKMKEGETDDDVVKQNNASHKSRLATLDIFAGCGGLSEGLQQSGVMATKWAIEYEEPAGEAFRLNHPEALMFVDNCNVILRAIMSACGDAEDCVSTSDAAELASKLDEKIINQLPRPGQVDFINGGPPCQGFSGMNRFNQSTWSKVQCEMILAFLSFAEYFRPKFFLLENVRNFVSFNKGQTFRLTLASLLEMGYQVRFGILEAGAYGVSQSRKRAFIWAASPEETLPEWPEPMHVFAGPELKVTLPENTQYAAVRNTASGAPFRAITVRDTIGDLPVVGNGASAVTMEYNNEPVSWYQKTVRGGMLVLNDHISKEMIELNLIRCKKIPKRPGADWRDLPDEKVRLSSGQVVDLIPWCLPNTAQRHNQWKGLFGRLDWEGNFPTSITDPQPMGKVGMCFHPEQDRILTVRECARSQGFPDSYKFAGNIQHKHRQIGNAVPPPLAFALGRKLKEAIERKST